MYYHCLPEIDTSRGEWFLDGFCAIAGGGGREGLFAMGGGSGLEPRLELRGFTGGDSVLLSSVNFPLKRILFIRAS